MTWANDPFPVPPWDTAGLPPRAMNERCSAHQWCAYRDDDPARCGKCHAVPRKCDCKTTLVGGLFE